MKTIHSIAYQGLLQRLREARKRARSTQAEAAARVGMSRSWLAKIEGHELRLDVVHLVLLTRVYGLQAGQLINKLEEELHEHEES